MKTRYAVVCVVFAAMAAASLATAVGQTRERAVPTPTLLAAPRYQIVSAPTQGGTTESAFLIDTETGRVWRHHLRAARADQGPWEGWTLTWVEDLHDEGQLRPHQ